MPDSEKLFAGFEPVTNKQWKDTATADLKGADFDKRLVWKTDEDIAVQPFYTAESLEQAGIIPISANTTKRNWTNYTEVHTGRPDANQFIHRMLGFGATGILLQVDEPETVDFNTLLEGVDAEQTAIAFRLPYPSPGLLSRYFAFLVAENINLSNIRGFAEADVLGQWSVAGLAPDFEALAAQLRITTAAENFKGLMLSSHAFVNAGASIVQECAYLLSKMTDTIDCLEKTGLKTATLIPQLGLHLAIGSDYFFEIAKLRALRPVLAAILKTYTNDTLSVPLLSSSSLWSKSLCDPNINMLRNTTEAMSAILGVCDGVLITPHDSIYKQADEFSHRIALNISNLLKEEAYFDKVSDPAAGSWYIESITAELADKVLSLFKQTEAAGGYMDGFKEGVIQQKIFSLKLKKEEEIASRKRVYVGTNKYVNANEKIPAACKTETLIMQADFPLLKPQRATLQFERLRQRTQQQQALAGRVPTVYLACFGNLAMRNARAAFSAEFFATAGFEVIGQFFFEDAEKAAYESANSQADIVVICSSDADYELKAKNFVTIFKGISQNKKLILAGYPAEIIPGLKQVGLDDFIHQKTNVVKFITALQDELFA